GLRELKTTNVALQLAQPRLPTASLVPYRATIALFVIWPTSNRIKDDDTVIFGCNGRHRDLSFFEPITSTLHAEHEQFRCPIFGIPCGCDALVVDARVETLSKASGEPASTSRRWRRGVRKTGYHCCLSLALVQVAVEGGTCETRMGPIDLGNRATC